MIMVEQIEVTKQNLFKSIKLLLGEGKVIKDIKLEEGNKALIFYISKFLSSSNNVATI